MNIAILAGAGKLPAIAAEQAREEGHSVKIYYAQEEIISANNKDSEVFSILRFGELLPKLLAAKTEKVILLGKVRKEHLFKGNPADSLTSTALSSLDKKNDDSFFHLIQNELSRLGIEIIEQTRFLKSLLLPPGVYSQRKPTDLELRDISHGMQYARGLGAMDIGQSVVVSDGAVMAVEAIEGTDECIKRAGKYAHGKQLVFCKAEKKGQDLRFDIPAVGLDTLSVMKESLCSIVAIEAEKTFVITPREFIDRCDELNMTFVAVK